MAQVTVYTEGDPPALCTCVDVSGGHLGKYYGDKNGWTCLTCGGFLAAERVTQKQRIEGGAMPVPAPAEPPASRSLAGRVSDYLTELIEVGRRHGFTLSHEDTEGGFLVGKPSKGNETWLSQAGPDAYWSEPGFSADVPDAYDVAQGRRPAFCDSAALVYDRLVRAHTQHGSVAVQFVPSAIGADLEQLAEGKGAQGDIGRAFLRLSRSRYGEREQVILLVVPGKFGTDHGADWQEGEVPH